MYVAAASQHGAAQGVQSREREAEAEYEKIQGRVMAYLLGTTQPMRKAETDAGAHHGKEKAECNARWQALA